VNQPTPALVTQRAAERLPRVALLLFCAAYLLPGLFGRDPWRNADLTAFGYMQGMAQGRMSWWSPSLGMLPPESALLPHWLGAGFIRLLGDLITPALAARLPFAVLLAATLALIWRAMFNLARTNSAQPLPFAFGGEASPIDYARALADGALLATMATLGLLQMGHETTPELMQLSLVSWFIWALSVAPFRATQAALAIVLSLPALALSGAPSVATALGLLALVLCRRSSFATVRSLWPWLLLSLVLAALLAQAIGAWQWRVSLHATATQWLGFARLLLWFAWPTWLLAIWTLWRWRRHWSRRHIAIPLGTVIIAVASSLLMSGSDRALMLAIPGLAILAAFALPTLQRSTGAAVDWFSVFFFSVAGLTIWIIYASIQTGLPAQPMRNILRLAPGYVSHFSALPLLVAAAGTLAWIWLVRWRTSRHRHPLWKSLVLPASGVALAWLLTMTLLLPVVDYARSTRPLVRQISQWVPAGQCLSAPGLSRTHVAGLEVFGGFKVDARDGEPADALRCEFQLLMTRQELQRVPDGWTLLARLRRPVDRVEHFTLMQRMPGEPKARP
jgi:4-amino-4-deoxy-L-arabinose transferase-like glycosyltransferase